MLTIIETAGLVAAMLLQYPLMQHMQVSVPYYNTELQAFVNAASSLEIPPDMDYYVFQYSKFGISNDLQKTWNTALIAKQTAAILPSLALACDSLMKSMNPTTDPQNNPCIWFQGNYSTATKNYYSSIDALFVLNSKLRNMLMQDLQQLDLIGADDPEYTGIASARFKDIMQILSRIINSGSAPESCNKDIETITMCVSLNEYKLNNSKDYSIATATFNMITSTSFSILAEYTKKHTEILESVQAMKKEFNDANALIDKNVRYTQSKLNYLDSQGISQINKREVSQLLSDIIHITNLTASNPADILSSLNEIKYGLSDSLWIKSDALQTFNSIQDNYLSNAIKKIKSAAFASQEIVNKVDFLSVSFSELENSLKQSSELALKSLDKDKIYSPLVSKASDLIDQADSAPTTAEAVKKYSQSIEYMNFVSSGKNLDDEFEKLENKFNALKSNGIDVSYEIAKLKKLKSIADPSLSEQVFLSLETLSEKADLLMEPLFLDLENLKRDSMSCLSDIRLIFNEGTVSSSIQKKLRSLESAFDGLSEDNEFITKDIITGYQKFAYNCRTDLESFSKDFIEQHISIFADFKEVPLCNVLTQFDLHVIVSNPLSIQLANISFVLKHSSINENLFLQSLDASESQDLNYALEDIVATCGIALHNEYVTELVVTPKFYLKKLRLPIVTQNISMAFSNSSPVNIFDGYIELYDLKSITKLTLQHQNSSITNTANVTVNDAKLTEPIEQVSIDNITFDDISQYYEMPSLSFFVKLLASFEKAVDLKVDINYSADLLIFSGIDYDNFLDEYNSLNQDSNGQRDKHEYDETVARIYSLNSSLLNAISLLESQAQLNLKLAADYFGEINVADDAYEMLNKASDSYKEGYYSRSIIYSSYVLSLSSEVNPQHEWIMLIAVVLVFSIILFLLKKPRKKQPVSKTVLKLID